MCVSTYLLQETALRRPRCSHSLQCPKLPFPLDCLLLTSRRYAAGTLVGSCFHRNSPVSRTPPSAHFWIFFPARPLRQERVILNLESKKKHSMPAFAHEVASFVLTELSVRTPPFLLSYWVAGSSGLRCGCVFFARRRRIFLCQRPPECFEEQGHAVAPGTRGQFYCI